MTNRFCARSCARSCEEGYAVIEAEDGQVMLEVMARERPDLVLMDVMMPGVDGRDAYRQLRSRPRTGMSRWS